MCKIVSKIGKYIPVRAVGCVVFAVVVFSVILSVVFIFLNKYQVKQLEMFWKLEKSVETRYKIAQ